MKIKIMILISSLILLAGCDNNYIIIKDTPKYLDVNSYSSITTTTGNLTDFNTCLDDNIFIVDEQTGNPALIINFTFTNITDFNKIIYCHFYDGTHDLHFSIYNNDIGDFIYMNDVGGQEVNNCNYKSIGGPSTPFINNGEVLLQITHPQNGVNSHKEHIDCLRLEI